MSSKRLKVGERVKYQRGVWVVIFVNDNRAVIQSEAKREVKIERPNGDAVTFEGAERGISISPYSHLERVEVGKE